MAFPRFLLCGFPLAAFLFVCPVLAGSIEIINVRTFSVPFGSNSNTVSINDNGDIAGDSFLPGNETGFIISGNGGAPIQISYPGASSTYINGISNQGTVVGYALVGDLFVGFTENGGTFTRVSAGTFTYASGINNHGDTTGFFSNSPFGDTATGFLIKNGVQTTFIIPGFPLSTFPAAINDSDQVAGYFNFGLSGFLRNPDGSLETFDFPAAGLNNAGIIVGTSNGSNDNSVGMVRIGDTDYAYKFPGASSTYLDGIDNLDEVVGTYANSNFSTGIFEGQLSIVATPEPSSASLCILVLFAGSILAALRRSNLLR